MGGYGYSTKNELDTIIDAVGAGAPWLTTSISDFDSVLLDDLASFYLSILDSNGDLPTSAEIDISAAVYKVYRSAGGAAFVQVGASVAPSKENGGVYFDYAFATADFTLADIVEIELSGVSVIMGGDTVAVPKQIWLGRITNEASIKATVEGIQTDLDNATDGLGALKLLIDANQVDLDAIIVETDKQKGGEYTGIVSAGTAAETTLKEITSTTRTEIKSIWLDFVNLTADATIKLYHKIDNATPVYRVFETDAWVSTDDDGVLITGFTVNNDFKITITGGEGAGVNIPYNIIYQEME